MTIDVRLPNGQVIRVNTDEDEEARRTAQEYWDRYAPRSMQMPGPRRESAIPGGLQPNASVPIAPRTQTIEGPDGVQHEMPADMPDEEISRVMAEKYPQNARPGESAGSRINAPPQFPELARRSGTQQATPGYQRAYQREQRIRDPEARSRRAGFGRVPVLDDVSDMVNYIPDTWGMADDAAGLRARGGQSIENVIRRMRGQQIEITADEAGDAAGDEQADRYGRWRTTHPALNAGSTTLGVLASLGSPTRMATAITPLQTAGGAMAVNAPFAVARQDGDFLERIPGALREEAIVGGLGYGLGHLANTIARPGTRGVNTRTAARAAQFEEAGVDPMLAAVQGRDGAPVTMAIAENPLVGGGVRRRIETNIEQSAAAADDIATNYGAPLPRDVAGDTIQSGIQRWATDSNIPPPASMPGQRVARGARDIPTREWSFASKASALYDNALGAIEQREAQMLSSGGGAGGAGAPAGLVSVDRSQSVLNDILGAIRNPQFRREIADPQLVRFAQLLASKKRIYFGDLRAFRTYVRELQSKPHLRMGVNDAGLQRLEAALTEDILASAGRIGGPQAAHNLHRVDTFYRAGMRRIDEALARFTKAPSREAAFDRLIATASDVRAGADVQALLSLKRALRPDEWRNVTATVIDRLGRTKPGAPNALERGAFSLENFVSNYAGLSPRGRRVLFGSLGGGAARPTPTRGIQSADDLAAALDNLAQVMGYTKGVRQFANYSRSGSSLQTVGTYTAVGGAAVAALTGNVMPLAGLAASGLLALVTGEMLSNPAFIRWLVSAPKAGATGGARAQLDALLRIASRDPAIAPLYDELADSVAPQSERRVDESSAPAERSPQFQR